MWRVATKLIKEVVETIVAFGLLAIWARSTFVYVANLNIPIPVRILMFSLLALGIILITRLLYGNYRKFRVRYNKDVAISESKNEPKVLVGNNPEKIVPATKIVKHIFEYMKDEASLWSHDAKWHSINFYISLGGDGRIEYSYQGIFSSDNKQLIRTQYFHSTSNKFSEPNYSDPTDSQLSASVPFYISYRRWRKAVITAVASEIDRITGKMRISVQHGSPSGLSIGLSYLAGKVEKETRFVYDGRALINNKTAKELRF